MTSITEFVLMLRGIRLAKTGDFGKLGRIRLDGELRKAPVE